MWFGGMKQACAVQTLKSLLNNMIIGVTEVGFLYSFTIGENPGAAAFDRRAFSGVCSFYGFQINK